MDICEAVGKRLRELRKNRGLSQEKMAETAGVNPKYYSEIERGKRNITLKVMDKISASLGITFRDFFQFPTDEKLSPEAEAVVVLITDYLKSNDEKALRRIRIFLTEILD